MGGRGQHIRPHLQRGFPWHAPEVVRDPCSEDEWWARMHPVFADAIRAGAGVPEDEARRLAASVRARYLDPTSWRVFDDHGEIAAESLWNGKDLVEARIRY